MPYTVVTGAIMFSLRSPGLSGRGSCCQVPEATFGVRTTRGCVLSASAIGRRDEGLTRQVPADSVTTVAIF